MKTAKERTKLFEEISRYVHYFDCNSIVIFFCAVWYCLVSLKWLLYSNFEVC